MACYAFYSVHLTSQIITSFARSNSPISSTTEPVGILCRMHRQPERTSLRSIGPYRRQPCSPPACTVRTIAVGTAGRIASRLHCNRFCQLQHQCLPARRSVHPSRDRTLATAFRSPATAAPLDASIPGSTFPACHFKSRSTLPRSVRLPAPLPPLVAQLRLPQRRKPVSGFPPTAARLLQRLRSPPGRCHPSGSKRSALVQPADPPAGFARFPLAPRCRPLLRLPAADHRSWVATFPLRSRGFRVLQSFLFQNLGGLSPSLLPFCPRSLPGSRVFGSGSAGLYSYNPVPPLLHFDATLSVLPPRLPPPYSMSGVDRRPPSESTSRKLRTLQHSKIKEPFFASPLEDV
jgi:hypothetical protein